MIARISRDRDARDCRRRPVLEALESRELPAAHSLGPALPGRHYPAPNVQQFATILYPPGTPQPTAAELKRESFDFKGIGRYTVGPGRFSQQSLTIHGYGKPGTSNMSRKFHFQFVINEPSSTAASQAVYGDISFVAGNYLQNAAQLNLNFLGPKGSEVNGLPTHLYWTMDANTSSSGPFAETGSAYPAFGNFPSNYFNSQFVPTSPLSQGLAPTTVNNYGMSLGDAQLKYIPDAHPSPGSIASGTVVLVMHGLRNYSGAQSQADQNIN